MKIRYQAAIVFVTSAAALLALRSRDCLAVDGAWRCLSVYRRQAIFFHPNNHLLYPVDVFFWTRFMAMLGFTANGPLDFLLSVEILNCLAGAGCLAILYGFSRHVTSLKVACGITAGVGLTGAFLPQATNANEPMLGVFWSFLGLLLAAWASTDADRSEDHRLAGSRQISLICVAGLAFALAMATYRSTVLLAPAALVLICRDLVSNRQARLMEWPRIAKITSFAVAGLVGCAAIFGWAYWRMKVPLGAMIVHFAKQGDERAYFGVSGGKLLNVPVGLVRNCFPILSSFYGLRDLLHRPRSTVALAALVITSVGIALLICALTLIRRWAEFVPAERTAVLTASAGLVFTIIPLLVWDPHYGKLWIQPFACIAVLVGLALNHLLNTKGWVSAASTAIGALFLVGAAFNLDWVIKNRASEPFEFAEAAKLSKYVGEHDLVVGDWTSLALIYQNLWAEDQRFLLFVDEAVAHGDGVVNELDDSVRRTTAAGGKTFFLGVLDTPKPVWDSFLGARCGVNYNALDAYRSAARLRIQFNSRPRPVSFWELDWSALQHRLEKPNPN